MFSILLYHGAKVDCTDSNGYTPLCYATRAGWLPDILELIHHGAKVNHTTKNKKTPLFLARNYDTVLLLLKYGADPNIKANELTAIEHLMQHNSKGAEAILDSYCFKDDEDNFVMDFHVFSYEQDEMSLFQVAKDSEHSSFLLLHPLMQTFLNFKFKTVKKVLGSQAIFHLILAIILSVLSVKYVILTSCDEIKVTKDCSPLTSSIILDQTYISLWKNESGNSSILLSSMLNIGMENEEFINEHSNISRKYELNICQKEDKTCFDYYNLTLCSSNEAQVDEIFTDSMRINKRKLNNPLTIQCIKNTIRLKKSASFFDVLHTIKGKHNDEISDIENLALLTLILLTILLIKEIYECIGRGIRAHLRSMENILELILIFLSGFFILIAIYGLYWTPKVDNVHKDDQMHLFSLHFAAWIVYFVWIDFTLYLGRIETIGQYIFMCLDVCKTILFCLSTFVPSLFGFTFGIYILVEPNPLARSYVQTFIRTIGMMVGEFNYDYIFDYDTVEQTGGRNHSIQIIYLFFVISMSIVVLNLLIALTVSKIDDLKHKSKLIQAKRRIDDVASLKIYYDLKRKIRNIPILKKIMDIDMTILERCQNRNGPKEIKKICIKNCDVYYKHYWLNKLLRVFKLHAYRQVFFYEDGKPIKNLFDFKISDSIYKDALIYLQNVEQRKTEFKTTVMANHENSKRELKEIIGTSSSSSDMASEILDDQKEQKSQQKSEKPSNEEQTIEKLFEKMENHMKKTEIINNELLKEIKMLKLQLGGGAENL